MTDVAFVIAGYGVILGSVAVYAFTLARRWPPRARRRCTSGATPQPHLRPATARHDPAPPRRRGLLLAVGCGRRDRWLAFSGIGNALVYYQTPTELLARGEAAIGESIRLGGLVEQGSISGPATDLTFVLTDGTTEVTVHSSTSPTSSFREEIGAVVEGKLASDGHFEADQVIVKHDENYVAPSEGEIPSQVIDPGT